MLKVCSGKTRDAVLVVVSIEETVKMFLITANSILSLDINATDVPTHRRAVLNH